MLLTSDSLIDFIRQERRWAKIAKRVGYRDSGCADRRDRRQKSPAFAKAGALSQKGRFFNARKNIIYSFIYFLPGKDRTHKKLPGSQCVAS